MIHSATLLLPSVRRLLRIIALLGIAAPVPLFTSCTLFKAKPAAQQSTLGQQSDLQQTPAAGQPFYVVRRATSPATVMSAARKPAIQVLPVSLQHLQPMGKTMARMDQGKHGRD